jgi:hypothetical protein
MKIKAAKAMIVKLHLLRPFETSSGVRTERSIPTLVLKSERLEGYSEGGDGNPAAFPGRDTGGSDGFIQRHLPPARTLTP